MQNTNIKKKRFNKKRTIELAKIWVENPTPQNAEKVILAMDELCWWLVNKRKKITDNTRISPDDLHQEARMGVWRAMQSYNPEKGCFVSYSTFWASQRIGRHISEEIHVVKFPQGADDRKVYAMYNVTAQEIKNEMGAMGISELHEEMARRSGLRLDSITAYYRKIHAVDDIDGMPRGENTENLKLSNILPDNSNQENDTVRSLDAKRLQKHTDKILKSYSQRDRDLVHRHMSGETMAEGARHHDITRERVRQIVTAAEDKILSRCMIHFAAQ